MTNGYKIEKLKSLAPLEPLHVLTSVLMCRDWLSPGIRYCLLVFSTYVPAKLGLLCNIFCI